MPQQKTITVYTLAELEPRAHQRALAWLAEGQFDHGWWDSIYEDAANVGVAITGFDLDRNRHCKGGFDKPAMDVAENIIREHGDTCETYKTAAQFIADRASLIADMDEGSEVEDLPEYEELCSEFLKSLLEDYSIMLQQESEYLSSEECLTEMAEANGYTFDEQGRIA